MKNTCSEGGFHGCMGEYFQEVFCTACAAGSDHRHPGCEAGGPGLVERLKAAGYRVVDDEPLEGYDRVYADDPFGNRVELMEPLDD